MRKLMFFVVSLLLTMGVTAQIDVNKEYRLKDVSSGLYLNAANHTEHTSGTNGGVNLVSKAESDEQIFSFEQIGSGYCLRTRSGYYIFCQQWNVDALPSPARSVLTFENAGNGNYYIKNGSSYFKVEYVGNPTVASEKGYYPFCDAPSNLKATWTLEPAVNGSISYNVAVLGTTDASAGVVFDGQTYKNNGAIEVGKTLNKSDFTATNVAGMHSVVSVDGYTVYVSYFSNDTKFYTIRNKKGGYVSINSAYMTGSNLHLNNTNAPGDNKGIWAFVADGSAYKVYNYSTGLTKVLGMTGSEANARASMVSPSNTSYTTKFDGTIKFNGNASYIKKNGTSNDYWNLRDGYLALWNSSQAVGDDGSTFYLDEVNYVDYPDNYIYEITDIEGNSSFSPENPNTLWYKTSAEAAGASNPWQEYALPLGNGELGCMVFGGVRTEELQFNEKTLWSGPANTIGAAGGHRTFVNFGSLFIINNDNAIYDGVTEYVRYLDLEEGIAGVEFKNGNGKKQTRRYFSSAPDQVIAGQYKCEEGETLNLTFKLEACEDIGADNVVYSDGTASFTGAMEVAKYAARVHIVSDGEITTGATGINVKNATQVTFFLKGGTNFNGDMDVFTNYFTSESKDDVNNRVKADIEKVQTKNFDAIEADHVAEFTSYTNRMTFDLGLTTPKVDTKELVDNYYPNNQSGTSTQNDHLFLEQLYFHYGRYLAISSNRKPIAAPNNLQGIWNNLGCSASHGVWNSDIHTNINIQMNYWPTEVTNLSDLHKPFLNFIIRGAQSEGWQKVARDYNNGDTKGWSVMTESSLYNSMSTWGSNYLVANVWYTSHLWTHWLYTQDKEFLKKAFPVMWSCAEFWFHRLKKVNGVYLAPNEYSPEHGPGGEDGTAHAQQMISYLFQNLKDAIGILGESELNLSAADIAKLDDYLANTDKGLAIESCARANAGVSVGTSLLREWKYSAHTAGETGHRHMSHLMALYPMDQITPESQYFTPAVNSLRHRGDEATGWSMGWKVNLWARAQDGDHAHIIIKNALRHAGGNGGVYYNLFDAHPPFQIDGNFGVCSGIAEMLMQSAHGYINIMPALPTVWNRTGKVTGMKAVGNFTVDFNWADGKCQAVKIVSNADAELKVRCARAAMAIDKARITVNGKEVAVTVDTYGTATIPCEKDAVVEIDFTTETSIDAVAVEKAKNGAIYDIQGRRVNEVKNNQVYIQDGVKKLSK